MGPKMGPERGPEFTLGNAQGAAADPAKSLSAVRPRTVRGHPLWDI